MTPEEFLATLSPEQQQQFLALPPEQQAAYASGGTGVPAAPNTVDPVLQSQNIQESVTDPLIRQLYFGTEDKPGFYNQVQQAGANLIGSDVPLQQTAGLSAQEQQAQQLAQQGLGSFQPYFQQQQDLINESIGNARRAESVQDPFLRRAESEYDLGLQDTLSGIDQSRNLLTGAVDNFGNRLSDIEGRSQAAAGRFGQDLRGIESGAARDVNQFGQSLGGVGRQAIGSVDAFGNRLGESESLLRGTLGGYNPNMTSQFYNPYENQVVQQTIDDTMRAGDQQDIAARAQNISAGGESAFGSRARLGADERREALGRGLGDALASIRGRGFEAAQQTGLGEFARQRDAERAAASGLSGFAGSRLGAEQQMGGTLRGLSADQLAAQQGLSNRFTSGTQSRLAADQGVIDLLGRTGQQQLAAQQGLAGNLQQYGQSEAAARAGLASGMMGIGQTRGANAGNLGSNLAAYGQQMSGLGTNLANLQSNQRAELANYGQVSRGINDMANQRQFQQQTSQQIRPMQTLQGIGAMLPGYQQTQTGIQSAYGMAPDPTAQGLGAAFSAYGALAPRQGGTTRV